MFILSYTSFLHQTTTLNQALGTQLDCLILLFYIKPQLKATALPCHQIVLYFFSTSNHNRFRSRRRVSVLSYTSFLHQTTTGRWSDRLLPKLSYTSFLHQTTTLIRFKKNLILLSYTSFLHQTTTGNRGQHYPDHCLILLFYIKPQRSAQCVFKMQIVLYFFSTSNHN